jgi:hypothetical protein
MGGQTMSDILNLGKSFYIIVNFNAGGGKKTFADLQIFIRKLEKCGLSIGYSENIFTSNERSPFWDDLDLQYNESSSFDGLIVVGGDGTKTYILNRLINDGVCKPFIGISTGTMNVSYTSAFNMDGDVPLKVNEFRLNAISTLHNNKTEYSFLEAVVGNTFVTTLDGIVSQASVNFFLNEGTKTRGVPFPIGDTSTTIHIKQKDIVEIVQIPAFSQISTIAVAPLTSQLMARVLAGGANPSACIGIPAGLIVSDFPLTWADVSKSELRKASPITSSFFPLDYGDVVDITGINEGYLVSDGNAVQKIESMSFKLVKNIYKIYK